VPEGDVAVVGAGNTGVQIAHELAAAGRRVSLSVSTLGKALPQHVLGRDLFWWFSLLRAVDADADTKIGRWLQRNENTLIGTDLKELFRRVERVGRAVDADGARLVFADGGHRHADAVVWASGYRPHYPWLHVPVLDESGVPIHDQGITDVPGLAFLGLPWQRNRGSALVGWVGGDAAVLADRLGRQLAAAAGMRRATAVPDRLGAAA
jgi:putative flavoprotein involved in K+ transport